jgi:cytochrome c oxidase subunit IV
LSHDRKSISAQLQCVTKGLQCEVQYEKESEYINKSDISALTICKVHFIDKCNHMKWEKVGLSIIFKILLPV